jgi:hypothetical protein
MERVLQILAVAGLLMLLIWRSIRGREERFRRFSYLGRVRAPFPEDVRLRLVGGVFGMGAGREAFGVPLEAGAFLWDEESRILLLYWPDGKLTINGRMAGGRNRELQELSVPMDCTGLGWDPLERKIYLEEDGDWFIYGEEG